MKPRYYQDESAESVFQYYEAGNIGNPLIALPTGTGKSLVNALIIRRTFERYGTQRILCLTHVKELIEQNYKTLVRVWPTAPAGIYSAGVGRKDVGFPITFGGIGSIYKKAMVFQKTDVVIVDEAHLIGKDADTMYGKFIKALKIYNPYLIVIGMSATPYRLGQGLLTEGGLFDAICCDYTSMARFNRLVDEGFISPLIPLHTRAELDVDGLHIVSGEYNLKEMQTRYDVCSITRQAIEESIINGQGRKHWLIFATGVEHCENVARMMREVYGIASAAVHSKIGKAEREEILRAFKAGELKAVVNNNVLTTGFDYPDIDLIIVLRPTNSPGLWVQMLGRGTRPVWPAHDGSNWHLWPDGFVASGRYDIETAPGRLLCMREGPKQNCLVLDFAANTKRLGPINDPVIPRPPRERKPGEEPRAAPVRICDNCGMYNHASVRECKACGYKFPLAVKIRSEAAQDELIKREAFDIRVLRVTSVEYSIHAKPGKPDGIKITYFCGLTVCHHWLGFDHPEPVASNARKWWRQNTRGTDCPRTVADAYARTNELLEPQYLRVRLDTKYPQVMDWDFDGTKFGNVE